MLTVDPSFVLGSLSVKGTELDIWRSGSCFATAADFLENDHGAVSQHPGWQELQDWPRGMPGLFSSGLE